MATGFDWRREEYRLQGDQRADKRADPRELMVHHQKINDTLADIYARAHKLEEENLSREDRIEQRWKAFERIGGTKPKPKATPVKPKATPVKQKPAPASAPPKASAPATT